jgi:hypothetical protein
MMTGAVIQSVIDDIAAGPLPDDRAAAAVLARTNGASAAQIVAAALGVIRQHAEDRGETIAAATRDLEFDRDAAEGESADLKIENAELRAKLDDTRAMLAAAGIDVEDAP